MYKYAYEAVLYRYSTDRQTMQFGKAVWAVSLFDADTYRDLNYSFRRGTTTTIFLLPTGNCRKNLRYG